MFDKTTAIICTECTPNHYENCPRCFGFGLRKETNEGEEVPVRAANAGLVALPDSIPCPICKSTALGIPRKPLPLPATGTVLRLVISDIE